MAEKGHSEEQILRALRQAESGTRVADICREYRISQATYYIWKKKYSGLGSVGDCFDNAMCESLFATLECELLNRRGFKSQVEARMAIFGFIEGWYNPHRRHSALDYLSPINYERSHSAEADSRSPTPSTESG